MEDIHAQVLRGFGIKPKRVIREKTYYICQIESAYRVIQKSFDNCESLLRQHEIKERLYANGFLQTDRFILSVAGLPYVVYDGYPFVMTELLDYREADFGKNEDYIKILLKTAQFHEAAHGFLPGGVTDIPLVDYYAKCLTELTGMKKRISAQGKFSDFDVFFLKNFQYYTSLLEESVALCKASRYEHFWREAEANGQICHHALKEENILINGAEVYLINFSKAGFGCRLQDLSDIISRYARSLPPAPVDINTAIAQYGGENPLASDEKKLLLALLKYPDKFIRLCNQYYSKKRTWAPSAIIHRMEAVIAQRDAYEAYIGKLNL